MLKLTLLILTCLNYFILADKPSKYVCKDGNLIELENTCNGIKDCADGSDETLQLCKNLICLENHFRCNYGGCVPYATKCDGIKNCADGSDESQCGRSFNSCNNNEFQCSNGDCFPINIICNKTSVCKDRSDNTICTKISCPNNMHRCKIGGCIYMHQKCNKNIDCIDGSDESDELCSVNLNPTIGVCAPLKSSRVSSKCIVPDGPGKGIVPCDKALPSSTKVEQVCKDYYIPAPGFSTKQTMVCQQDGTWNKEHLKCEPECGLFATATPLIVQGWYPNNGIHPWHAILYELHEGEWAFTCGASLISEKIVITAAHCVWNNDVNLLKIALGKQYSDLNKIEDTQVIKDIARIIRQPLYQDSIGNYGSDIAILELATPVEFSEIIRPICIDWKLDDITDHLAASSLGFIVGLGVTEDDVSSDRLKALYLPVVLDKKCINSVSKDYRKYITFTSFCAGWGNGSSTCNGDSGGGLVFPMRSNPQIHVLQGIVSLSQRRPGAALCDPKIYTIFTKVGMYVEWINKVLMEIHEDDFYDKLQTSVTT